MRAKTPKNQVLFKQVLRAGALGIFVVFALISLLSLLSPVSTSAAASSTLNFQARLETAGGAIVPDGNYNVEFKIYNASSSSGSSQGSCTGDSACLWTETRTGANQVRVVNGYLTVNLGSVNAFGSINWNQQMWLTMRIGGTGTPSWDAEMSPRIQLTAVPYAFQAGAVSATSGANIGTLSFGAITGTDNITLPDATGTVCLQNASACGFAPTTGGSGYIQLQATTPGSAQTGNFNITGTGILSSVQSASAASGTVLTIQGGAATSGTNVGGNLLLQGGAGASTGASGSVIVKSNTNNSTTAFQVQNASSAAVFTVDTTDKFVGINTTSTPLTTLQVVSNDTTYGGAIIENTDTTIHTNNFAPLFIQHDGNTNGDSAGIGFRLQNASSTLKTYAYIGGVIQSSTAGAEIGQLVFQTQNTGGGLSPIVTINSTGVGIQQGVSFTPQYTLQVIGNTDNNAVGPLVVQTTTSGSSIGTALTLDASPTTGGHKWSFLSTGPQATAGAGSFSVFDGTANAYRMTIGTTGNVGVGITAPTNLFQIGTQDANATATRTNGSTTLVGSGTGWSSAQVGDVIVFFGGYTNTVVSVADATHLTMASSYTGTTDGSPVSFVMYKVPFNVTSAGNTYAQTTSTAAFQVQNASGTSVLNVDTSNKTLTVQAGNDITTIGSELYGSNFSSGWTATGWNVGGVTTAIHNTGNTNSLINTSVAITTGTTYQVGFTASGACPANPAGVYLDVYIGSVRAGRLFAPNCDGSFHTFVAQATSTTGLTFTPASGWPGTISNISIKAITGVINPALVVKNNSGTANIEIRADSYASSTYIGLGSGANDNGAGQNTALGSYSLQSNTSGYDNTALGAYAMQFNTTGQWNTAVGNFALWPNTIGVSNTAIGNAALSENSSGSYNTALGDNALSSSTTASYNVAIGKSSLFNSTSAANNTYVGYQSGYNTTTGGNNTGLGYLAGYANTTGTNNTALGYQAGYSDSNGFFSTLNNIQNASAIGTYAQVQASGSIVLGSVDTATKVGIGITVPSNAFSVSPLDYQTGTATRTNSSASLVGTTTTWTSAMVGDTIVFADGTTNTVSAFTDATHITMGTTFTGTTDASPVHYRFHKVGFQVTSAGNAYVQNASTTAFRVQNASGASLFTADTTNTAIVLGNDTTPSALTVRGGAAAGTDVTGANITFDASNGTGAGGSGDIIFRTASASAPSAVTYYSSSSSVSSGTVASLSWSHTIGSSSNRLLMVNVMTYSASVSSVTYNGTGLTNLSTLSCATESDGDTCKDSVWYLKDSSLPAAGTYTVQVNLSASDYAAAGATSFYNVNQTSTFGSTVTATQVSNSIYVYVPTTSTQQMVFDAESSQDYGVTQDSNQTLSWSQLGTSGQQGAAGYRQGTGSTLAMSWTKSSTSAGSPDSDPNDTDTRAVIAVPINPLTISSSTTDTLTDVLHLTGSGNVGIKTSNPQATLSVNGNAYFSNGNLDVLGVSTPPASPAIYVGSNQGGSLLGDGTSYYYQVSAVTSSGESIPSAEVSIGGCVPSCSGHFTPISAPGAPTLALTTGTALGIGAYKYVVTYTTANGETGHGTEVSITTTSGNQAVNLTNIPIGPTGTTSRKIYRTVVGGGSQSERYVATIANNTSTTYSDTTSDASLQYSIIWTQNTATTNTNNALITWSPVSGATSYKIYRGTSRGGENVYFTSATNSYTDTGSAGTSGTEVTDATARLGIGTTSPRSSLDVIGSATIQSSTNSTTALQVLDSAGTQVVSVDTKNQTLNVIGTNNRVTYGSELYGGSFNSGWTSSAGWPTANWTVGGGGSTITHVAGNTTYLDYTALTFTVGATYKVVVDVSGTCGTSSDTLTIITTNGVNHNVSGTDCDGTDHTYISATTSAGNQLFFFPTSNWTGTISFISIEQVTVNLQPSIAIQNAASSSYNMELRTSGSSLFFGGAGQYYVNGQGVGENTSYGYNSLQSIADGFSDTAIGSYTLQSNTYGYENTAVGDYALNANDRGNDNTALGAYALDDSINGSNNIAIGSVALTNHVFGDNNTAIGTYSLYNDINGTNNVALGYKTGYNVKSSGNTFIGYQTGYQDSGSNFATTATVQNATALGAYAQVQASNSIVLGSVDTATKVGIGTTVPSNTFSVSPLDYQTGTVTRTNSSTTLTGTSTVWTAAMAGDLIIFADGTTNTVLAVNSNTSITLGTTYTGTTDASPVYYRLHRPGFQVTSSGSAYVQNSASNAFQIQGSDGNGNLLLANTNNTNIVDNSSFESNANGWVTNTTGVSIASSTAQALYGNVSLAITAAGGTSNVGAKFDTPSLLLANTTYTISVWAISPSSSFTIQIGRSDTDAFAGETSCAVFGTPVSTTWTRYSCSFTTGATVTTGGYVFVRQSDSTARTWYVDGVQVEQSASATVYHEGSLQFNGTIASWTTFQNAQNGTNSFQVQNASGSTVFNVDTIDKTVGINNASPLETLSLNQATGNNIISFQTNGTSQAFLGVSNSAGGVIGGSSVGDLMLRTQSHNVLISTNGGTSSQVLVDTSGNLTFQQASTIGEASVSGVTTPYQLTIQAGSSSGVTTGANLLLQAGAGTTSNGVVIVKASFTAGTIFQVQNSSSTNILSVAPGTNPQVKVGAGSTGEATPSLLVLDSETGSTADPTEVDGAMYYNTTLAEFRCGKNGFWFSCSVNNIQHSFVFEDEFLGGTTVASGTTSITGVGDKGWNVTATTLCAVSYNQNGPTAAHDHPGNVRLQGGAASGDGCAMTQGGTAAGTPTLNEIMAAGDDFKTSVAIDATARGTMRVGFTNATSNTAPTSGAYFEYASGTDATHWRYCYANNAAATCAATTLTIAANTWYQIEIRIISSTAITFIITPSGSTAETHALTGITYDAGATNKLGPMFTCYATTTTATNCYMDYYQWSGIATTTGGR